VNGLSPGKPGNAECAIENLVNSKNSPESIIRQGLRGEGILGFLGISTFAFGIYLVYLVFHEPKVINPIVVLFSVILWFAGIFSGFLGLYLAKNRKKEELRNLIANFRTKFPRLFQLLIGLAIDFWIFLIAEAVFWRCNVHENGRIVFQGDNPHFMVSDPDLGYKPRPEAEIHVRRIFDGKQAYDVLYHTDNFSRRITPALDLEERNLFALFFGCSITFGVGVQDDQTMEFFFSNKARKHRVYNYACSGYGPQSLLAKLRKNDLKKEIIPQKGVLYFVFFNDHLNRAVGSTWVYNVWVHDLPYFFLDGENRLLREGNFDTGRPVISFLYRIMWRVQTLSFSKIEFPLFYSESHFQLVARIFLESYRNFQEQFPGSDFFVVFFPGASYSRDLIPLLKTFGVPFLDYSGLIDITEKGYMIEGDGHPTPECNKIIGEKLASDLGYKP